MRLRRWFRWTLSGLGALLLLTLLAAGAWVLELKSDQRDYLLTRHGQLVEAEVDPATPLLPGVLSQNIHLRADTGLEADLRLIRPAGSPERPRPLLLLLGGHRTGRRAVDLVGDPGELVVAAIDYPYRGPHQFDDPLDWLRWVPRVQRALLDTPPALSLALDWLVQQPWVDPNRVELCGVSLGVPFATVAGALDARFQRVWLVQGAGDNHAWAEHALTGQIANDRLRPLAAEMLMLLAYDRTFDTARWVAEIAPRPVVVIASDRDERLPRENIELLYAAAREPVEIIWMSGGHVGPGREAILAELRERTLARVRDGT